ncbi:response regulator [Desulfovibrio inopinatus]|uniref:response regulator n=1 Tax=Desulfovibrio inopinatus TaxID=102109 RepID=UPI00041AA8C9|nr:response regulator [Desulfovibrio inopinatus]
MNAHDVGRGTPPVILVIDDVPDNLKQLTELLENAAYRVMPAQNGPMALRAAEAMQPDLILLDIRMPGMNGFEVCTQLKHNPALKDIPVIFISALGDTNDKVQAFEVGGVDYITKPFNHSEVLARVKTHIDLRQAQNALQRSHDLLEERVLQRTAELESLTATLQEREEKFRTVADFTYDWEYWIAPDGHLLWISPSCERFTGYTPADFMADPDLLNRIIHPDDKSLFDTLQHGPTIDHLKKGGQDFRIIRSDGRIVWLNYYYLEISRADGTPLGRRVSNRDITERKQAENQIKALFNATTDTVILLTVTGVILAINEQGAKQYGCSPQEMIGRRLDEFSAINYAPHLQETMQESASLKCGVDYLEVQNNFHNLIRTFPIFNDAGEPDQFAIFIRDVTKLALSDKALRESLAQAKTLAVKAEAANRAKSEFLANMSHEIRTPLNGIVGMLQILEKTPLNDVQKEYLAATFHSAKRLTRLLSDILDLSKIEAGKLELQEEPFDLISLKQAVTEIFSPTIKEKGLDFNFCIHESTPSRLLGDEVRLRQILFNVVGNAIKFTEQGQVKVDISPVSEEEKNHLVITVKDTGIGIRESFLKTIFEPFVQGESSFARRFQGAGLGLSIVRKLVTLMAGELSIESTEGQGTTVSISLPFKGPSVCSTQVKNKDLASLISFPSPLRILYAEDDEQSLKVGKLIFEKSGHIITAVNDGREALQRLKEQNFDLILMDIQMPVMDGVEATRAIRKSASLGDKAHIPIIALTAHAMTGDREKLIDAGINDYISKPFSLETLFSTIKRVVDNTKRTA